MVQAIKRPLKKILGRTMLNFDELNTLVVEIEGVVYSRSLTYVYNDTDSISYPLTPSDLIYGWRIASTLNISYHEIVSTYDSLTRRMRHNKFRFRIRSDTSEMVEHLIDLVSKPKYLMKLRFCSLKS